jgi:hypothetical protein
VSCFLYRHYDADGVLLYVGMADQPEVRERQHDYMSVWHRFSAHMSTAEHPTRKAALVAEQAAIKSERPLFNLACADDAEGQAVEYLAVRGAWDGLTIRSERRRGPGRRGISTSKITTETAAEIAGQSVETFRKAMQRLRLKGHGDYRLPESEWFPGGNPAWDERAVRAWAAGRPERAEKKEQADG